MTEFCSDSDLPNFAEEKTYYIILKNQIVVNLLQVTHG